MDPKPNSTLEPVPFYSAPEACDELANNAPEVIHGNQSWPEKTVYMGHDSLDSMPESVTPATATTPHTETLYSGASIAPPAERRILGLRRRVFWAVLAVSLILIIGAAVGAGIGVSMHNKDKSTQDQTSNDGSSASHSGDGSSSGGGSSSSSGSGSGGSNSDDPNTPGPSTISTDSQLATISWMDTDRSYSAVYFQDTKGIIRQAVWQSDTNEWSVNSVASPWNMVDNSGKALPNDTKIDIKPATPITASVSNDTSNGLGITLLFLTSKNEVRELVAKSTDGPWAPGKSDGLYTVDASSSLAVTFTDGCKSCAEDSTFVYQFTSGKIQMWNRFTPQDGAIATTPAPEPIDGSALAMVPLAVKGKDAYATLFMNTGKLTAARFAPAFGAANGPWAKSSLDEGTTLSKDAKMAAISYGIDGKENTQNAQVFFTDPDSGNGVKSAVADFDTGAWADPTDVADSSDLVKGSAIAANQAQMLFGLTLSSGGSAQLKLFHIVDGASSSSETVDTTYVTS